MNQSNIIIKVLEHHGDWKVSHQLEKVSTAWGWLGTSALKRCRELVVKGRIEKTHKEGYVWYRMPVETPPAEKIGAINTAQQYLLV